ncbi:DUF6538 domain-containing protein [Vibrio sp. MA40-2]|uniref:DUF6538 domain-containing protein n=1 Tax=Vibrio sp. MA40-2 TaxID=3391828 RepID=UPI0039A626E7
MVLAMTRPSKTRHGVFQTRVSVPKALRAIIGASELKRSLDTKDENEARHKHGPVLAEFRAEIEKAKRKLESESKLTDAVIDNVVFEWRKKTASLFSANPETTNPFLLVNCGLVEENHLPVCMVLDDLDNLNALIKKREKSDKPLSNDIIKKKQARYFGQLDSLLTEMLLPPLASYQIEPSVSSPQYRKLLSIFAKAYISISQSALKQKASSLDLLNQGATLAAQPVSSQVFKEPEFEVVWEEYQTAVMRREPGKASRLKDYAATVKKFLRLYPNKPIDSFAKRDIAKFRNILEQLPTRPKADIAKLSFNEQIEKADLLGLGRTSPASVKKQISAISAVFTFAVQQDYIQVNPVQGTVSDIKKTGIVRVEGKGYTTDELSTIFNSKLFHEGYSPDKSDYGTAHYWLPLMLYYTGARAEEIAQLYVDDVCLELPIPYIRIHGERDDQSVKTGEERRVPIHKHLLELGLDTYLASLPTNGRVFPKLTKGSSSKYHVGVAKWLANFIRDELGINREGLQPLHGLRHAFISSCREQNVRVDIQKAITGHSQNDVASHYGGYSLELMDRAIQARPNVF